MSGHSKWATIKHKKAATDSKRGKLFTKLIKMLTVAAKNGGGSPDTNPSLRLAIDKAKEANMPQDNIERAIKKGTGELPGVSYESVSYEGYGPGGVAFYVDVLTDNKNRVTAEVRTIFSKIGGNLAGAGAVSWLFEKKGLFIVNKKDASEDKLMSIVLDAGAEDMSDESETYEIKCQPVDYEKIKKALDEANIKTESAEVTFIPKTTVKVTGDQAKQVLNLVEQLEDNDDVQNVYANFDIPDDILDKSA
ncbi:MAG: YebC/PmpR family DNA-binding transcriptional regulator [Candidatus Omnitrophica bacterium]|nr:YebC/PmpR family DNA-binding transcriptional regulator [Candidatus Omnitrophota bacterium]MCG2705708.1 YebC/PmpR family DNA-binding transcriptional regulator [Candidatus Omnitrophota bacterium]